MTPASHRQATRGDVYDEKINGYSFQVYSSSVVPARHLRRQQSAGAGNTDTNSDIANARTDIIANAVSNFVADCDSHASRATNPENNQA